MGLLHRRRELCGKRYRMREKLFTFEDYWIETRGGERAFKASGKALRFRETFDRERRSGEEIFKVQQKKLHLRDTMKIEQNGDTVATVQKARITPLSDRFAIKLAEGTELSARGNTVDHEHEIGRDGE